MTQTAILPSDILDPLRYITRRIASLEDQVKGLAQESGGAFTSIETGDGTMDLFDDDGNLLSTVGMETGFLQVETVYGAPTPEDPDVSPGFNSLIIAYDGTFTDGDWDENNVDHVEIHATALDTDTLDDQNQIGTFTSSNGGVFTYPWNALDGGRWIWLQAVTTAGEEGTPSNPVFAVPDAIAATDGVPPATAPTVTVEGAIQAVVARWDDIGNADPTFYRVFAKAGSAPSIVGTTDLFINTPSTSVLIDHLPGGGAIAAGTTVHIRVIGYDEDGDGPASVDASDSPIQIGTGDVLNNAITSPLIGDAQIITAKIAPDAVTAAEIAANAVTSSELASNAVTNGKILDGAVSTLKVANLAITAAQVANDTLTSAQIAAAAVTNSELAALAVDTANIISGAVTTLKIANATIVAGNIALDTITAANIAANAVTSSELAADAVTNTKILDGAVSTLKVANTAITAAQIALTTITAAQIANDTITASQIATNGVTATEIATDAVTTPKLIAGAVTAAKITAHTITANEITALTITASEIAATTITGGKLVADTITANEIAANAITTSELAALSVNASKIVANTITSAQIAAGTITATEIQALTITGAQIAATTITGGKMVADTITANEIAANAITTSELNALAVTAAKIAANTITAGQIAAGTITATEILGSTITGAKIAATTITASNIVADTITANEIASNAITVNELAALSVNASKIVANTITAAQIAAGTITATEIAALTITAAKIAAGTITGNEIAANTLTANKLLITAGGGNMFTNSSFFNTAALPPAFGSATVAAETGTTYRYGRGVKITAVGSSNPFGVGLNLVSGENITTKLQPLTTYSVSAWVYNPSVGGVTSVASATSGAGIASANTPVSSTVKDQWVRIYQTFTTGASGVWGWTVNSNGSPAAGAVYYIGAIQLEPGDVPTSWSPKADEILPGTIVASMISADTITANEIAANAITTSELNALSVTAAKIVANTITAGQIAANTITAAQITALTITANEIAATTITAAKIAAGTITANEIAANTITAAKIAAGTITGTELSATSIDGKTITGATLQTASSGQRVVVRNDGSGGIIEFFTSGATTKGVINPSLDGDNRPMMTISSALGPPGSTIAAQIRLKSNHLFSGPVVPLAEVTILTNTTFEVVDGQSTLGGGLIVNNGSTLNGSISVNGGYTLGGGGQINGGFSSNNQITITGSGNSLTISSPPTQTNAANAFIGASGVVNKSTSLSKYKLKKQEITLEDAMTLTKVTPQTWFDRTEFYDNGRSTEGLRRIPGVVAEDVEKNAPMFALYDIDGALEGVAYDRMGVALIPLIKDLYRQIDELKAQMA